jgi:short-subunit dehydrogenase
MGKASRPAADGGHTLEGRHVVITGASSGIGAALAREAARRGAKLTLVARRHELLHEVAAGCRHDGDGCQVIVRDLVEPPPEDWLDGAEAALGPVDVLVNNAGMENTGPTVASDIAVGERVLRLNLVTPLVIIRRMLPKLARRGGAIVNVASVAALAPTPQQTWYGASKAGLAAFSESLRGELRGTGVDVLTVYPGPVTTPMAEAAYAALGGRRGALAFAPEGRPEVLARRTWNALARRRARLVYPRFYSVARWFPSLARWLVDELAPRQLSIQPST